ncbi:MAG TPA: DNA repair helicase XPB [Planctomycetota bacterium]|nr:DNA repair helicase XPB [Planctomycetota bacterium]
MPSFDNPLIVQSDRTILLEVNSSRYEEARDHVARFAEIEKSPEHIHTYRLTPLSLWNAAAAGMEAAEIIAALEEFGKYPVPQNIRQEVHSYIARYGLLKLLRVDDKLVLFSEDPVVITEVWNSKSVRQYLLELIGPDKALVNPRMRGHVKQALIRIGYPVEDLAGYVEGDPLPMGMAEVTVAGHPFHLRHYQQEAADVFHAGGSTRGGSGVIVLPCGAGKTVVGMAVMSRVQTNTLVICTSLTALNQWSRELLDKTTLREHQIGEYSSVKKEPKEVTLTTYQMLTYRKRKTDEYPHFEIFNKRNWGLIIYDEVHLLPAPVFRITAEIQACRRLGLTATLVREDHKEDDVFSLIGPKRYDVPWKVLEKQGWIATAKCIEIRVPLPSDMRVTYATADGRSKFRLASENPLKIEVARRLIQEHPDDLVLIIGQYISQVKQIAKEFDAPIITGTTPNRRREELYRKFREHEIKVLVVSKVGNFAVDLPDANVAIQVSGTFGSRQEEAQRLGRILRPKKEGTMAYFYSLITRDTRDQEFSANRQLFLTEQGYSYEIRDAQIEQFQGAGKAQH